MEISLIRHGKSMHTENQKITSTEFKSWIEKYDSHGVFEENIYPASTLERVEKANVIITSDLRRSIESARLLSQHTSIVTEALFREAELPTFPGEWGIRLRPSGWSVLLRCLWLCGYSRECESFADAKQRAKAATEILVKYAEEHQAVLLVGHGILNSLIGKELRKMGWYSNGQTSAKHWNCTTYSRV